MNTISFTSRVEVFPMQGGWMYVRIPQEFSEVFAGSSRGFTKVNATIGESVWQTSVMPLGYNYGNSGGYFLAIKKEIRKARGIEVGDVVKVEISLSM